MTFRKLAGFLKAHWPLVPIAIAVAVIAFVAGSLTSNQGVADEPTPKVAPTPAAASHPSPTPTVPPELYATPTHEQWERWEREYQERKKAQRAASGNAGESQASISRAITITATPRSTAEAQFREAPLGSALYFVAGDKVIFLPEGVEPWRWVSECYGGPSDCPRMPVWVLKKGESTVSLNAYGDVVQFWPTDDPDEFPFLKDDDDE